MIIEKKEFNVDSAFLINAIFSFFPVSFIFGNLITTLNVGLFCILGILWLSTVPLTSVIITVVFVPYYMSML